MSRLKNSRAGSALKRLSGVLGGGRELIFNSYLVSKTLKNRCRRSDVRGSVGLSGQLLQALLHSFLNLPNRVLDAMQSKQVRGRNSADMSRLIQDRTDFVSMPAAK